MSVEIEKIDKKGDDMPPRLTDRKAQRRRKDLAGEHKFSDAGQLILACVFMAMWVADSFFFRYTTVLNQNILLIFKIPLGIVLFMLSGYLARKGLSTVFGEERKKPGVIRSGVFGIVRHPIYLGEILLYLGFLMLSTSLAAAVVLIIAIGFLHYISRCEEKLLLARFGKEYERYMGEVPMWIPRLRRKGRR